MARYSASESRKAWVTRPLPGGSQTRTYLAQSINCASDVQSSTDLVVKLFKKNRSGVVGALNDEIESLCLLNGTFCSLSTSELSNSEWKIGVPELLFSSQEPPALITNYIEGSTLDAIFINPDEKTKKNFSIIIELISIALRKYWSDHSKIFGDLNYSNIICDIANKTLTFIDPGMPDNSYLCEGVSKKFWPSSHDFGYLMFEVIATNVKIGMLSRKRPEQRTDFVKHLVHHYMTQYIARSDSLHFLREMCSCSRFHVKRINVSKTPVGIWRHYVAEKTLSYIDRAEVELWKNHSVKIYSS